MASDVTTIYIDDSAIRALTCRGRQPRKWATAPLNPGLVRDGVILDENAIAGKIRELWQSQKFDANKVIAGISGINCLYRLLSLPELPKDLLSEAVSREAARVLGVPLEQLHISWQILSSVGGETLIYLAAVPKTSVDAIISTLHRAGLTPYLMDLKPLALARTITEPGAIIIDLQPSSFDIVVMADGIPQVARSLPLTQGSSLNKKMASIAEEMDRAITFYNSSHKNEPIEATVPVLVCGELTEHEDFWNLLTGKTECPVQALPSPMAIPENFLPDQYMVNIGLALKEVLLAEKGAIIYSRVNLNILPEIYIPKPRPVSEVLFMPVIVGGIALVALGAFLNISSLEYTATLRNELAGINQKTVEEQVEALDIIRLGQEVRSLEEIADIYTDTFYRFATVRDMFNGDLSQISSSLLKYKAVKLLEITHNEDTIVVRGLSDDEDNVFFCARDLRASGRFVNVVVTEIGEKDEGTSFILTLTKSVQDS